MRRWLLRVIFGRAAMQVRQPWQFSEPRIARLPSQDLRELVDELFGHVRQLQADVRGVLNAHRDVMARLQEVTYREGSAYAANTRTAQAMADVEPAPPVNPEHGTGLY